MFTCFISVKAKDVCWNNFTSPSSRFYAYIIYNVLLWHDDAIKVNWNWANWATTLFVLRSLSGSDSSDSVVFFRMHQGLLGQCKFYIIYVYNITNKLVINHIVIVASWWCNQLNWNWANWALPCPPSGLFASFSEKFICLIISARWKLFISIYLYLSLMIRASGGCRTFASQSKTWK